MKSSYNNNLTYKELLENITFLIKPKTVIEFGILEGFSLNIFAQEKNCRIYAYDIFDEFNGNSAEKNILSERFKNYQNVNIDYGDFYKKYNDIENNSIDIIHIDIANDGKVYQFAIDNYYEKLKQNGILILEGGSKERDNVEWMLRYNKPTIQPVLQKYGDNVRIEVLDDYPSITLISK